MRERGTVKTWNEARGFGFLWRDNGEDLFVHISACGNVALVKGMRVEFGIEINERNGKPQATDVHVLMGGSNGKA